MNLVTPDIGLLFWMVVSFGIVLFLLKKFAWKPILNSLNEREATISEALNAAKKAREEMASMNANTEALLNEARGERDKILKEAREAKESIISEAKVKAEQDAERLRKINLEAIENAKMAAITDLKNKTASLAIEIAEKIIRQRLADDEKQKALISDMLKDAKWNG
jgi:F-type H+-transporting ATPase subunit b